MNADKTPSNGGSREPGASFRDEVRSKYPALAERARTGPKAAIRLFCIECMGGSRSEARTCQTRDCFLWPHRGAAWNQP